MLSVALLRRLGFYLKASQLSFLNPLACDFAKSST